ncbi:MULTISPECIES: kinase-associated lipoprotein B [Aeribacillus]|uniref:Kinase n=2 Tax=Aeribacillus TaxID=1055323 RepID=A0A165YMN0_9BACI|nr:MULTISPECIES: kinase-associated lipoprotein B [Aeribacillus]REJ24701.1 MAG: kinase [Bacillaceae bacterium]ASS90395.1 kinase [Aeribacillus pallidus]KZM55296.1 kinase [Aeribacillus pallidus]KZN97251.1 kinase [Aeribacillus pallidus]MDR9797691.1 kinase-associated lipoprotein B [Aeribacillus pallidus]
MDIKVGDIVTGIYKTGKYIGEVTEIRENHYLVRVKAVLKHPMQGDLHQPKQADVPFFHERKALSFNEQANIPKKMVHHYNGEIPDYETSLKEASAALKKELEEDGSDWALRSLENLNRLEREYFKAL